MPTLHDFEDAYEYLSQDGICDSPDGKEYHRVLSEWLAAGRPTDVEAFIRESANQMPG